MDANQSLAPSPKAFLVLSLDCNPLFPSFLFTFFSSFLRSFVPALLRSFFRYPPLSILPSLTYLPTFTKRGQCQESILTHRSHWPRHRMATSSNNNNDNKNNGDSDAIHSQRHLPYSILFAIQWLCMDPDWGSGRPRRTRQY